MIYCPTTEEVQQRLADEAAEAPQSLTKPDLSEQSTSGDVATASGVQETEEAMITRLAGLNDLAYYRVRMLVPATGR